MNKQIKPLKIYPKVNEDVFTELDSGAVSRIGSHDIPLQELIFSFRSFLKDAHLDLFDKMVKYVWLEQHITYNGNRRYKRKGNGFKPEQAFCFFMTGMVGYSQKTLMGNPMLSSLVCYLKDFFPNFSDHNPFEEPEFFEYPYKHVTLDFLYVVREHHERLEMLKHAEDNKMTIREFVNWAANRALCYNLDVGEDVYSITRNSHAFAYIKNNKKYGTI